MVERTQEVTLDKELAVISLSVYLTPREGKAADLEHAIKNVWIEAMEKQPGFISAAMNTPFPDDELDALEAAKPSYAYEVISYWNSEEERAAWAARDIHQEVWPQVVAQTASVSYSLFNVKARWGL